MHIPHANAYPIAGRVKDFHPAGYPADEPMVPHGMAVSLTAPETFRFTFDASPERHRRAAQLLAPGADEPNDPAAFLPAVLTELMRDIGIPAGIGAVGYDRGRHPRPRRRHDEAAAAAGHRPQAGHRGRRRRRLPPLDRPVVTRDLRPATDGDLLAALRGAGLTDVDGSGLARALYSSDASLYRVLPRAVVRPRHADEIVATLEVCRSLGVPLTARGAGTSIAGNAVGPGVVLDTSRHLNRVLVDRRGGIAPRSSSRASSRPRCRPRPSRTACGSAPTRARTTAARSAG